MSTLELVARAAACAAEAHARQRRKTTDEPFINHPIRVARAAAEAGLSPEAVAAAYLHDVVEDTRVTAADLRDRFPGRVCRLVALLTQGWADDAPTAVKEREKPAHYAAVLADPEALSLKLLDRADNLLGMVEVDSQFARWADSFLRRTELEYAPLHAACGNETVRRLYADALERLRRVRSGEPDRGNSGRIRRVRK